MSTMAINSSSNSSRFNQDSTFNYFCGKKRAIVRNPPLKMSYSSHLTRLEKVLEKKHNERKDHSERKCHANL